MKFVKNRGRRQYALRNEANSQHRQRSTAPAIPTATATIPPMARVVAAAFPLACGTTLALIVGVVPVPTAPVGPALEAVPLELGIMPILADATGEGDRVGSWGSSISDAAITEEEVGLGSVAYVVSTTRSTVR